MQIKNKKAKYKKKIFIIKINYILYIFINKNLKYNK